MAKYIDPTSLGLPSRTVVEEIDSNTVAIVIKRKSRIIMADGIKILSKTAQIKSARPGVTVLLKTVTPICSKTLRFFDENSLEVIKDRGSI
jgi:hypothetical protein